MGVTSEEHVVSIISTRKEAHLLHPLCMMDPRSQIVGKDSIQYISLVAGDFAGRL